MKKLDHSGDTLNYTSEQKCLDELPMQFDPTSAMAKTNADGFVFGALEPGCDEFEEIDSRPNSKPTSGELKTREVVAEDRELEDDE